MRKTIVAVLCVLLLTAGLFAEGRQEGAAETYKITAGLGLNDKSAAYEAMVYFKELVEEGSDGRIVMEIYHSSQLGDDREMMEALQRGEQEMTVPSTAPIVPFVPEFGVFDLPFLFPKHEDADRVLDGEIGQRILDKLSDVGLKGLVYWENGYRNLTNSVREVRTPADVKGMKVRTMENPMHLDAWRTMGANPTPMAFGELFSAMQQGVVDGQENPWGTIYLQNFHEVQTFASDTGHVYSPFVLMISQKYWDNLPADLQKVVMDAAVKSRDKNRELNRKYNKEYMSKLKEVMTVSELTLEEKAQFQTAVQSVYDQYADAIGRGLINEVMEELK
ncbi:ABC transporter substrate-binding protein [Marispirochaeta aestuarii]|uniref:ABC transporter substrate-binding protein n=1 Tax=Marispirochaeta aestuarii TaxID=1963862 RepID=A0A1Y1RTV6_9SPIO|nr:TRAP transporter substrate-binding protein [Marispirochaeta aestuarii]ORC31167.1 ABC transporter substrate-binding protein [Marispirochaeta aestuarii]